MADNGKGKGKGKDKGNNPAPPEPEVTRPAARVQHQPLAHAGAQSFQQNQGLRDFSLPGGLRNETTLPSGPPPYTSTAPASYTQSAATSGQGASSGLDEAYPVAKHDFSSPRRKVQGTPSGPPAVDYSDVRRDFIILKDNAQGASTGSADVDLFPVVKRDFSVPGDKDKEDKDKKENNKKDKGKKGSNDKDKKHKGLFGKLKK
ncbi:hypothetical protein DL769_007987 [Monosporascus sp. CRB-8-3]|nr:hypothetical protein DL769_007987 [Monosporascus sp. CRB-8-3]